MFGKDGEDELRVVKGLREGEGLLGMLKEELREESYNLLVSFNSSRGKDLSRLLSRRIVIRSRIGHGILLSRREIAYGIKFV